ncbi:protein of unknown function [Ruminococcus flavefaciens]|uniref:Transcobalamin-like C-terminal domain-containing protein n=2 Tax=Ruminococcus flavefaciens TaxID=1265 RepID=A0A1H6JZU8_RUMFL|nr:protein of unknown function [Ruminococcus flavefaciens]
MLGLSLVPLKAECCEYTADDIESVIGGIVDYKLRQTGSGSVQEWLGGEAAEGAGRSSDWYVIALSQDGYTDLSAYESSLRSYLAGNNIASATSREKFALALCAAGSSDSYISDILDSSIGEQGMMSWIYGLHVLNNGYTCHNFTKDSVVDTLLSMQYDDGGWALFGSYGDIDVTAMTVQALAPNCGRSDVSEAVDRALDFMSSRQEDNGGYQSFGTPNPESAAQVLTALSALGIDCRYDDRFIKNGNNVIDGITAYQLSDGSFCHAMGEESNETATVQSLYSLIAFKRMTEGRSPLLVLDNNALHKQSQPDTHEDTHSDGHHDNSNAGNTDNSNTRTTAAKSVTAAKTSSVKTTVTSAAATTKTTSSEKTDAVTTTVTVKTSHTQLTVTTIASSTDKHKNYKPTVILIIVGAAAVIAVIIFIIGKRNYKNFIFLALVTGAAVVIVLVTDISSPEEYYSGEKKHKDNAIGTVTMEINCGTIAGKAEHIPADGVILAPTAFDIEAGDTVFDILTEAAQTYGIQVENTGSSGGSHGMVYIAGINYIYEFDFGDLSGWVYHVNGITPSRNCGEYVLSDGDKIEWLYTCELGHDLDEVYEK